MEYKEQLKTIEELIDLSSIPEFLENVATVCRFKEEHLQTNWQDKEAARYWARVASKLDKVVEEITI
jgi:hypothetical protein